MVDSTAIASRGERRFGGSVESRSSWVAAALTTAVLAISYGAPLLVVVGLKPIAASLGTDRSVVALASALVWVGTGMGGIVMGWVAGRIGGLGTVLAGSVCQAIAIAAFTFTQDEIGLFAISAAYGLGFSGIVPAYVLAVRELFPSSEASWRVPILLFVSMSGMAFGGWFAGALYDHFGFYAPAFAAGALFNVANVAVIGFLVVKQAQEPRLPAVIPV